MLLIEEEEIIVSKPVFSFKYTKCHNIFDRSFWDMKPIKINGVEHGYSRRTRLIFSFHCDEYNRRGMLLVGMRGDIKNFIPAKKCPRDVLKWCLKNKIQINKNKELFMM